MSTQPKPQFAEVDSAVQPMISLVIANVGGPSAGTGTAAKRKKDIAGFLHKFQPNIVLLQEFSWVGITGPAWKNVSIPDKYEYTGNNEASILYDKNEFIIEIPSLTEMEKLLDEMIRKGKLPMGFTPISRMCTRVIKTKGLPNLKFICVSWHGRYKGKKMSNLVDELKQLLLFLQTYSDKKGLPFIVAGDYNIPYEEAKIHVNTPLVIYQYQPLKRREGKVKDFFIGSELLPLDNMSAIDWRTVEGAEDAYKIFDHDPIYGVIRRFPRSKTRQAPKPVASVQQNVTQRVVLRKSKTLTREKQSHKKSNCVVQ